MTTIGETGMLPASPIVRSPHAARARAPRVQTKRTRIKRRVSAESRSSSTS